MYAFALLLTAALAFPFPPSEAERLLREVDAKIVAGKTLRVEFEVRVPAGVFDLGPDQAAKEQTLVGSLVLGDRNRFRYELKGCPGADTIWAFGSDGTRMGGSWMSPIAPQPAKVRPPVWHNEALRQWLGRGGTAQSMDQMIQAMAWRPDERPGAADGPRTAKARLLPDEKVGSVQARVVEYEVTWSLPGLRTGSRDQPIRARVWIDPTTNLPLRRTMASPSDRTKLGAPEQWFTAIHTKFEIDPKLDDKLFEFTK